MRAVRLVEYDSPPKLVEVDYPKIGAPTDVIVKIAGAGVCRTDVHIVEGGFRKIFPKATLPYTLGHENVGWVEECGPGAAGFRKGDPVVVYSHVTCGLCEECRCGRDMYCPNLREAGIDGTDGGFAEFMRTTARCLVRTRDRGDLYNMAAVADAGISSYHAIKRISPSIHPGSIVVVFGMGGLGHFAVQLLKLLTHATVVVISESKYRLELARRLGADHCVVANPETAPREVINQSRGLGAQVVLDLVGSDSTAAQSLRMLRKGGTYSVVGYGGMLNYPTQDLISKEISIIGNLVGSFNELSELVQLCDQGKIGLQTERFPLERAGQVFESLMAGKRFDGRPVLIP